jgi:ABC-2 type transport system permease protein
LINTGFLFKEIRETVKTPRLIVITAVFAFFAILSPLGARYINEIIASLGDIEIVVPDPTYYDAWIQFFKNMNSICMIVFLLTITGLVVSEKTKGSIMLVLSKNLSRMNFILSKIIGGIMLFTTGYAVALLFCFYYTYILFPGGRGSNLVYSLFLLWLLGVFYLTMGIFASVIAKTPTTAAILGFAGYAVVNVPAMIPETAKYTPGGISAIGTQIISAQIEISETFPMLVLTAALILLLAAASILIFRKQEI